MPDVPDVLGVAVTRAEEDAEALASALTGAGLTAIGAPLLRVTPLPPDALAAELRSGGFDWTVCTSRHAVEALGAACASLQAPPAEAVRGRLGAVGRRTAGALEALGLHVDLVPAVSDAMHLADAMLALDATPQRVLFPRAREAREALPAALRQAGWTVVDVVAYDTVPNEAGGAALCESLAAGTIAAITLASGSAARALASLVPRALWSRARLVSIGPTTTADAAACGLPIAAQAETPTMASLAEATRRILLDSLAHA